VVKKKVFIFHFKTQFKAGVILRNALDWFQSSDKFAAAQSLAMDNYCDKKIIDILLTNYFRSKEDVTKQQVIFSLANLSIDNVNSEFLKYLILNTRNRIQFFLNLYLIGNCSFNDCKILES
jgi:hypothetical protein